MPTAHDPCPSDAPLLRVEHLVTSFSAGFAKSRARIRAVDDVSFDVARGETLAIVGESGCGKSVTALSILRLLPTPPARIEGGRALLEGRDLLSLPERAMREVRGAQIAIIFQEPMTSLNPVYRVGWQVGEALVVHRRATRAQARARAIELLAEVGMPHPQTTARAFPHELSGGQRQRVLIAMALACEPKLLVADEPTTALDVTIQAQILELIAELRERLAMALVLITHDLAIVAERAQRVVVMYAGQVVEEGPTADVFSRPAHPYTRGLIASTDRPRVIGAGGPRRLPTIAGIVPDLRAMPPGCRFEDRCPMRVARCAEAEPSLVTQPGGRSSRCYRAGEVSP